MEFFDDLRRQFMEAYRSRTWPPLFLTACVLAAGILSQWIIAFIGLGGFLYWQFFKSDR